MTTSIFLFVDARRRVASGIVVFLLPMLMPPSPGFRGA